MNVNYDHSLRRKKNMYVRLPRTVEIRLFILHKKFSLTAFQHLTLFFYKVDVQVVAKKIFLVTILTTKYASSRNLNIRNIFI